MIVTDQVQDYLNQLASLVGVQGAFIFNQQGTIKQYSTPMKVSLDQGVALARSLARTLTGLSTVHSSNLMDIDLVYGEGRLVVKGVAQGGLCVICERQANYSLLNLTLEQGLGSLRKEQADSSRTESIPVVERLVAIAEEMLGEHAPKVISILESAGSNPEGLENAIQQAENLTRMFINRDQAGEMAQQMRSILKNQK